MLPAVLELRPDEPDPVEIGPHGETLVFLLHFLVPGVLLSERLMIERQSQHDVCPDLPGVKCAVEPSKLHRAVAMEEAVEIKKMVAATVVVLIASFTPVSLIPDAFDLSKGGGFDPVHAFHEVGIHFLAVAHPLGFDLQCLIEQVVVTGDDVHKIADAARRVVRAIQVDMDATGFIGEASGFT